MRWLLPPSKTKLLNPWFIEQIIVVGSGNEICRSTDRSYLINLKEWCAKMMSHSLQNEAAIHDPIKKSDRGSHKTTWWKIIIIILITLNKSKSGIITTRMEHRNRGNDAQDESQKKSYYGEI